MPQLKWDRKSPNGTSEGSVAISASHSLTNEDGKSRWFKADLWGQAYKAANGTGMPWHLHVEAVGVTTVDKEFGTPEEGMQVAQDLLEDMAARMAMDDAKTKEKREKVEALRVEMEQKINDLLGVKAPDQME